MSAKHQTKTQPLSFEQSVARLDSIVRRMDEADTGLEEMIALVEEGLQLIRSSREILTKAELRIHMLEQEQNQPQNDGVPEQIKSDNDFSLI